MKRPVRSPLGTRAYVAVPVVALLAALATLMIPAAATASTIYPPVGACSVEPAAVTPGATVVLECDDNTFSNNETVTITVTGENGAAAVIGMVKFAITTASGTTTSTSTGALERVSIVMPSDATGTYNIAAVSPTSSGGTAAASITRADGGLPGTGLDSASLLGLWVGGGALVLAGLTLTAVAVSRRVAARKAD